MRQETAALPVDELDAALLRLAKMTDRIGQSAPATEETPDEADAPPSSGATDRDGSKPMKFPMKDLIAAVMKRPMFSDFDAAVVESVLEEIDFRGMTLTAALKRIMFDVDIYDRILDADALLSKTPSKENEDHNG